jgi:3-mercaptopyruvate sulfurtransferase SseA
MLKVTLKHKVIAAFAMLLVSASVATAATDTYYQEEEKVNPLIEASELYKWVKNGQKTLDGKRVIIMDIVPAKAQTAFFEGDVKTLEKFGLKWAKYADKEGLLGHIPGAQLHLSHDKGGHISTRNDGPIDVIHQLGDAKTVNEFMQKHGITKDSVVVLTTADFTRPNYCDTRAYWTLRYWGMSKNNLRVLNGGNAGWAQYIAANHPDEVKTFGLEKGKQKTKITRSDITVADFSKKFTEKRAVIGEIFAAMDSGAIENGSVNVLDFRPPSAFFVKDIKKFEASIKGSKLALPSGKNGAAVFDPKLFSPIVVEDSNMGAFKGDKGLVPYTLSSKAEAFEGQIKGAVLFKGKTQNGDFYDIGFGTIFNTAVVKDDAGKPVYKFFTTLKQPTDIATKAPWAKNATVADMFAKIFPDKDERIIITCNSGSAASIGFFYASEVMGYTNVADYDGSFIEWGNLAAFEPNYNNPKAGLHVVLPDSYTWLPMYPMNMPAVTVLASGEAHPFHIEQKDGKFIAIDNVNGDSCVVDQDDCWVKTGGPLKGNMKWDTVSRSQNILFRPTAKVNTGISGKKDIIASTAEYNKKKDWAAVKAHPDYEGNAQLTVMEDSK